MPAGMANIVVTSRAERVSRAQSSRRPSTSISVTLGITLIVMGVMKDDGRLKSVWVLKYPP